MKAEARAPVARSRHVLVSALGITQILAWGSSYYLPAVLAAPIAAETGWSLASVVAGLSCGLLLAGLASPIIGRLIQRHGGRPVLAASSLLLAAAHLLLAAATVYPLTCWPGCSWAWACRAASTMPASPRSAASMGKAPAARSPT
ncbi:hypothetical protein [Mesorhizobium sp. M1E.F.Ca.ET.045.02.1.1]|uniref:hypothetical protein n=1 Tax=Mesorhizobium sp. M1E.F.Ca.ET.045.02.1.1 TaxID=2493672 RepID=UPI001FDF7687|nr:hypothetical protein [Mesorhizobium sp. M1E.F.Ca.ET.045.02.1.1]